MEEFKVDGYQFDSKADYEQALREQSTIKNIREKMNLSDPKIVLSLYNQAVSKRTFKTPVGYAFLKKLRDALISSGIVDDSTLNCVPVVAEEALASARKRTSKAADKKTSAVSSRGVSDSRLQTQYENEKKRRIALSFVVAGLIAAIVGIFVLTFRSKYSYITYFTDYETNIRNEVIDEYEEWKQQLDDKEKELDEREQALEASKS